MPSIISASTPRGVISECQPRSCFPSNAPTVASEFVVRPAPIWIVSPSWMISRSHPATGSISGVGSGHAASCAIIGSSVSRVSTSAVTSETCRRSVVGTFGYHGTISMIVVRARRAKSPFCHGVPPNVMYPSASGGVTLVMNTSIRGN